MGIVGSEDLDYSEWRITEHLSALPMGFLESSASPNIDVLALPVPHALPQGIIGER